MADNRRRQFLINKPFQLRYMLYLTLPVFLITTIVVLALYAGIWGSVLDAFNDEKLRSDLLTASRLTQYEEARQPADAGKESSLLFFKQSEKLSQRQREVFKDILNESNRRVLPKLILILVLIAWGSIYISHKIAGPLYRFRLTLEEIKQGNLRVRVALRKEDEGKTVAGKFNDALVSLDQRVVKLKKIVRENETDPPKLISHLKDELSKIKTSADI